MKESPSVLSTPFEIWMYAPASWSFLRRVCLTSGEVNWSFTDLWRLRWLDDWFISVPSQLFLQSFGFIFSGADFICWDSLACLEDLVEPLEENGWRICLHVLHLALRPMEIDYSFFPVCLLIVIVSSMTHFKSFAFILTDFLSLLERFNLCVFNLAACR